MNNERDYVVDRIFEVVESVTGVKREDICSGSRIRETYYARMMVGYHLRQNDYSVLQVCTILGGVAESTLFCQLKGYLEEQTPYFRNCAEKVRDLLNKAEVDRILAKV